MKVEVGDITEVHEELEAELAGRLTGALGDQGRRVGEGDGASSDVEKRWPGRRMRVYSAPEAGSVPSMWRRCDEGAWAKELMEEVRQRPSREGTRRKNMMGGG